MKRFLVLAALDAQHCFGLDSSPVLTAFWPNIETVFFVDPQRGDDSRDARTRKTAWRTIARANQRLQPGQGVTFLVGIYEDQRVEIQGHGL